MKNDTFRNLFFAIVATLMGAGSGVARIGETKAETAERYGKPTFTHDSETGSFIRYLFKGKIIEVVFVDDEAKMETLYFEKVQITSHEIAEALGKQSTEFVISLLTNAYDFTDEKAGEVLKNRGQWVAYGREKALLRFDEKSITNEVFAGYLMIAQNEMPEDIAAKMVKAHQSALEALKQKERIEKSDGF